MVDVDVLRARIVAKLRTRFPDASPEELALAVIDIREEALAFTRLQTGAAPPK